MRTQFVRPLTAAATVIVVAGAMAAAAAAAAADPGPGTFTRITSPASMTYKYDGSRTPGQNTFTVSGRTSSDVTSVDIVCTVGFAPGGAGPSSGILAIPFATDVPVTSGSFSTVVSFQDETGPTPTCRLRALPSGVSSNDYLGSYSGPLLRTNGLLPTTDNGGVTYGYTAVADRGDGVAEVFDAATCGAGVTATVDLTFVALLGLPSSTCAFALPGQNVTASGTSTASSLKVDGHDAYLPGAVYTYLRGALSLSVAQTALTTSFSRTSAGDISVTESAPLMRCSSDTFPPTTASCPELVPTGVTFRRTADVIRDAHQIRLRDTFTSTSKAAHTVSVQYVAQVPQPPTGEAGFEFPGSSTFAGATSGQTLTGLGHKAASVLVRSDRYADTDEPGADTRALAYSRAPSKIQFGPVTDSQILTSFGMSYTLAVPGKGSAFLGFAESGAEQTEQVLPLTRAAVAEMTVAPTITSPRNKAKVKGRKTVVKGTVAAGANGLPTSVSVNGHKAKVTTTSTTRATWTVTFSESLGRHTLKATATDAAGNTASSSVSVTNT